MTGPGRSIARAVGRLLLPLSLVSCTSLSGLAGSSDGKIVTDDVERFYRVYEATSGHPSAEVLQHDYIDAGSDGLRQFARVRELTGATLAAAIAKDATPFETARRCATVLPAVRVRLDDSWAVLRHLYPPATRPPLTILIGRANTGGTTTGSAVMIGLEVLCMADFIEPDVEDRFVHVIAHELAHVQQPAAEETDAPGATVLFAALIEGGAEFIAEQTSGGVAYSQLGRKMTGRELEIESAFAADIDRVDLQPWLYNGRGDDTRPGDLGYWIGYRIVKSYYLHACDKRQAIDDIVHVSRAGARTFLARSGWSPGMATSDRRGCEVEPLRP